MNDCPIQLAVLISGGGTTLQNLIDQISAGKLRAQIKIVIASRPGIAGIDRAKNAGLKCEVIEKKTFANPEDFSRAVFARCKGVDLIGLAGWLSYLHVPPDFDGKVMNIHPSLLPAFGGQGMYGLRVHQAVLASGAKESGCTVHFVDNDYDTGPVILQRRCPVLKDDTAQTLAHRVFDEERIAYPEAIELFRTGRLQLKDRGVQISKAT
jgi:phosphoribosylglycinamide formyltransferase 1